MRGADDVALGEEQLTPMPPKPVEIGARVLGAVKLFELVVSFANKVVVANDDTGNAGEEDGVRGEIGRKVIRRA